MMVLEQLQRTIRNPNHPNTDENVRYSNGFGIRMFGIRMFVIRAYTVYYIWDPKSNLVWYLNGPILFDCPMVLYSSHENHPTYYNHVFILTWVMGTTSLSLKGHEQIKMDL